MQVKFVTNYSASPTNKNFNKTSYEEGDIEEVAEHVADYLMKIGAAMLLKMEKEEKPEKPKRKPRKSKPKSD